MHNCTYILLLIAVLVRGNKFFLVVSFCNDREEKSLNAKRRLDNVGNVLLVSFGIEIFEGLSTCIDMLCKVVVCTVCNAPEFAPAEREEILKVSGSL